MLLAIARHIKSDKKDISLCRDQSRGVDGVASYPPSVLQLHNFPSKLLPDLISQERKFKHFSGATPPQAP